MGEREATIRTAIVVYFPMFIATLSLVTSIYNGYLEHFTIRLTISGVDEICGALAW